MVESSMLITTFPLGVNTLSIEILSPISGSLIKTLGSVTVPSVEMTISESSPVGRLGTSLILISPQAESHLLQFTSLSQITYFNESNPLKSIV